MVRGDRLKRNLTTYEADWQATIMEAAAALGWWTFHVNDSRRSEAGFLDCFFLRSGRLICAELKDEKRPATPEQLLVMGLLREVPGVEVYLWRPNDPDWDEIQAILA